MTIYTFTIQLITSISFLKYWTWKITVFVCIYNHTTNYLLSKESKCCYLCEITYCDNKLWNCKTYETAFRSQMFWVGGNHIESWNQNKHVDIVQVISMRVMNDLNIRTLVRNLMTRRMIFRCIIHLINVLHSVGFQYVSMS